MTLGVKIRALKSWVISGKKTVSQKSKPEERRKVTEPQNWEASVWETVLAGHRHWWDMWVMLRVPKGLAWWSYRGLSLGRTGKLLVGYRLCIEYGRVLGCPLV